MGDIVEAVEWMGREGAACALFDENFRIAGVWLNSECLLGNQGGCLRKEQCCVLEWSRREGAKVLGRSDGKSYE